MVNFSLLFSKKYLNVITFLILHTSLMNGLFFSTRSLRTDKSVLIMKKSAIKVVRHIGVSSLLNSRAVVKNIEAPYR